MKAKPLMIQGTASSVGKSLIVAGLCRIFRQDGYRVAPFKSQNMALNSFITREGKEMGRAQVVQAEAAGIEPVVALNPILIKPTTDQKAQVIVNGEVLGNMSAVEYHQFKPKLAEMVRETYEKLAGEYEIIVIEGAGSPAEINLRDGDLVNMGMAEIADAPVLLVGDIDKGGVFASLAGTMLLLTEAEKERIKGVIINKFRGDLEILKPGLVMLEAIIKRPVLGVVPYLKLNIDDEDSVTERFSGGRNQAGGIEIAVVKLPRISNFTDFNALENHEGVSVKYLEEASTLGRPDLVIMPGSKNTMEDLLQIRRSGLEAGIKQLVASGVPVMGICGGFQMLGREIRDPHHTESFLESITGMGLLETRTIFAEQKTTTQAEGVITDGAGVLEGLDGVKVSGYEIHMGSTEGFAGCFPCLTITRILDQVENKIDGLRNQDGMVFGTYLHGIFDNPAFTAGLINNLRLRKGLEPVVADGMDQRKYKEEQYDRLAGVLREGLDLQKIYGIIGK